MKRAFVLLIGVLLLVFSSLAAIPAYRVWRGGLLCATESGNCVESWNGSDIYVYSDQGSTQKFHVDGATGNIDSEGTLTVEGSISSGTGAFTVADTLNVTGAATFDSTVDVDGNVTSGTGSFTVADTINVTGAADFDSTLNLDGNGTFNSDLVVDDTFNIDDTAYTSTGAQTLDPTASFYTLAPAAVLTLTLGTTTSVAGDFVTFVSTVTTDTIIVDTTATAGGGNITLDTAGDVMCFVYTGSLWAQSCNNDNS